MWHEDEVTLTLTLTLTLTPQPTQGLLRRSRLRVCLLRRALGAQLRGQLRQHVVRELTQPRT